MTEFDKADLNNNSTIERGEWNLLALEDRRLEIHDQDLKRNAERRFTGIWGCRCLHGIQCLLCKD